MEWTIREFERTHPGITIEWTHKPGGDYYDYILASAVGGIAPDVFYVRPGGDARLYHSGLVYDIDPWVRRDADEIDLDGFVEVQFRELMIDGKWWALPDNISTLLLRYNSRLFAEAGIPEPTPDLTWHDAIDLAAKLTRLDASGHQNSVWGFGSMNWFMMNMLSEGLYMSFGGSLFSEDGTRSTANSPGVIETLSVIAEMGARSVLPLPSTGVDGFAAYLNDQAAMILAGSWDLLHWGASEENLTMVPQGLPRTRVVTATGGAWTVSSSSRNPEAAWEFVKWITSAEVQRRRLYVVHSTFPSRKSVLPDWLDELRGTFPGADIVAQQLITYGAAVPPRPFAISTVLPKYYWPLVLGEISPEEAAIQIDHDFTVALMEALQ